MLIRFKILFICIIYVVDNMEIIYNVVILFFFFLIVMIRLINKIMDNNKIYGWIKIFLVI